MTSPSISVGLDGAVGPDGTVVVVGGGIAGVSTVAALRRSGHRGPVTVLDEGDVLHDRPPLSKAFLRGDADVDDVRLYPPAWFVEHHVRVRTGTGTRAVTLDAATATVGLADGSDLVADAVVLAQGGVARTLDVPGGSLATTLRTLPDARLLRDGLRPGVRLVVVGAGLVGAEVAATASSLGASVTLVDPDPLPLARVVGGDVARILHADHASHGVQVVTDEVAEVLCDGPDRAAGVEGTASGAVRALRVRLVGGVVLGADLLLVATGIRCADDLARSAGLTVAAAVGSDPSGSGGVVVDDRQRASVARVLAVGDVSRRRRADGSVAPPAGHWDAARLDGEAAAATLLGLETPPRGAPWFWSDRYGRHVEVTGYPTGGIRTVHRGDPGPGPFSVMGWRDGVLTGAVTVDDPRTARAVRRLVDRRVVVDPDVLADPAADLRSLLRS